MWLKKLKPWHLMLGMVILMILIGLNQCSESNDRFVDLEWGDSISGDWTIEFSMNSEFDAFLNQPFGDPKGINVGDSFVADGETYILVSTDPLKLEKVNSGFNTDFAPSSTFEPVFE